MQAQRPAARSGGNEEMMEKKTMSDLKQEYQEVPIPEEGRRKMEEAVFRAKTARRHARRRRFVRRAAGSAAAVLILSTVIGLNTNAAFAREMSEIPVFGTIARVLTVRSYEEQERNVNVKVEVPEIQSSMSNTDRVNEEIDRIVSEYVADAKERMEEYREAYLATGGTEEEWEAREIEISTDYTIKSQTDKRLSLALECWESWASFYGEQLFYNIDLETGEDITLQDLLGENYAEIAGDSIRRQMKERMAQDENQIFWGEEEKELDIDGFTEVTEKTKFYINEAGNPVIVFDKYEVAPGYMGQPEFEIIP